MSFRYAGLERAAARIWKAAACKRLTMLGAIEVPAPTMSALRLMMCKRSNGALLVWTGSMNYRLNRAKTNATVVDGLRFTLAIAGGGMLTQILGYSSDRELRQFAPI